MLKKQLETEYSALKLQMLAATSEEQKLREENTQLKAKIAKFNQMLNRIGDMFVEVGNFIGENKDV